MQDDIIILCIIHSMTVETAVGQSYFEAFHWGFAVGRVNAGGAWNSLNNGVLRGAGGRGPGSGINPTDGHTTLPHCYIWTAGRQAANGENTHTDRKERMCFYLLLSGQQICLQQPMNIHAIWLYRGEGSFGGRASHLWQHSKKRVGVAERDCVRQREKTMRMKGKTKKQRWDKM